VNGAGNGNGAVHANAVTPRHGCYSGGPVTVPVTVTALVTVTVTALVTAPVTVAVTGGGNR